jgi:hypothetical protein
MKVLRFFVFNILSDLKKSSDKNQIPKVYTFSNILRKIICFLNQPTYFICFSEIIVKFQAFT